MSHVLGVRAVPILSAFRLVPSAVDMPDGILRQT